MPSGALSPNARYISLLATGSPNAGGTITVYQAGTLVLADTFSDAALTVPNSNPIALDAAGTATIYLAEASYDFVEKDASGNVIRGPITIPSTTLGLTGGIGEIYTMGGTQLALVTDTAYPAGATQDKLHTDSAIWPVDSANLPGTYALQVTIKSGDGVHNVTVGLVNLSDGSPDNALVECAGSSATGAVVTSGAITFPAGGTSKNYGIKVKVDAALAAVGGNAWGARIVRLS